MSEVLVRVSSSLYKTAEVLVNGQREKFTKNGHGGYELSVDIDDGAEIVIRRNHELLSPLWLLWGMLFFVISCFGIFDVPYSKKATLMCRVRVFANSGGVIQFTPGSKKSNKPVLVESFECTVDELENTSEIALIKKRRKTLGWLKFFCWLALIAALIAIVFLKH